MLYCKFHILHISVMFFQSCTHILKLLKCFRELLTHFLNMHWSSYSGNNIFTLCVSKELSKKSFSTSCRISCKCNTSSTVIPHITKCHRLYINCCSPRIRNIIISSVYVRTWVVPGTEYSFYSSV